MIFKYLLKDNFLKSLGTLTSGSLLAQLITLITAPVMTRLFTVSDIGFYTYIMSISYLFLPVINGRYEYAIVSEKINSKVLELIKLCIYVSLIFVFFIFVLYLMYYVCLGKTKYIIFLSFVVIHLLIGAYINVLTAWNNRFRQYFIISKAQVVRALALFVLTIIFGLLSSNIYGLLLAVILSNLFSIKEQSRDIRNYFYDIVKIPVQKLLSIGREYKSYLIYSLPASFINNFSYIAVNFCIGDLYGLETLGYYALSFRILGMPLSLISSNISKVFFEQSSREYDKTGNFKSTFKKSIKLLVILAVPIGIGIYFISPWFCEKFFGSSWAIAGEYIKILTGMFVIRFIVSPLSICVMIVKNNKFEFFSQIFFALNILISYYFALKLKYDILEFLFLYSTLNIFVYVLWLLKIFYLSGGINVKKS